MSDVQQIARHGVDAAGEVPSIAHALDLLAQAVAGDAEACNIGIAMVNYGPIWAPAASSLLRAVAIASRACAITCEGIVGGAGISDRMPLDVAENLAVLGLLEAGCTHIFLTENDMILPPTCLLDLLSVQQPVVSGLYFLRAGDGQPCLYRQVLRERERPYAQSPVTAFPTDRPFRLDGCTGVGCLLVERAVFERLERPWFVLDPQKHGSDMYFSGKCREADIPIWVHPGVRCGQIEYKVWEYADYEERLHTDPDFRTSGVILSETDYTQPIYGGAR